MARSGAGIVMAIARDVARYQRQAAAAHNRAVREAERQARAVERERVRVEREYARTVKEREREEKARYLQDREQEAADLNAAIADQLAELDSILPQTLLVNDSISFEGLRIREIAPQLELPDRLKTGPKRPQEETFIGAVVAPRGWRTLIPGAKRRHELAIAAARQAYGEASAKWQADEMVRIEQRRKLETEHAAGVKALEDKKAQRNAEVDEFETNYRAGDPDAIIVYYTMVLERSSYPEEFPQKFSIAYTAASELLVIEYELPPVSIVPEMSEHRFVRSTDTINGKPRKAAELKEAYEEVIASVALRTIHEVFEADQNGRVKAVCFNGYIHTVDPATGRDIQPHLISVRTTAEKFGEIDLARVDKRICLKNLGAQVSRRADEAQPVKPIVEFQMADARFVDQRDLVSGLSSVTNLMELNPFEFEELVANLFGKMGLESKLTRSSRDGGVDCVAYDARPVLGGKVVIQAKRYRHTVGVSAVRDLFGTMMNEGANKGILVTTSGYGPDAFDFAKDKPIELLDGGALLFLLQEIGVQARIVFPEDR
jgi:restriction system protein